MTFFATILKYLKRKPEYSPNSASEINSSADQTPFNYDDVSLPESLFVDKTEPMQTMTIKKPAATAADTLPESLKSFLASDYRSEGYRLGYDSKGNADLQKMGCQCILSEYRNLLYSEINSLQSTEQAIDLEVGNAESLGQTAVTNQLKAKQNQISLLRKECEHQMELSLADEGWVAKALNQYKFGFSEGFQYGLRQGGLL